MHSKITELKPLKFLILSRGGWGWGDSLMKGARMPVVSLRRVNFRFWSHLGCSVQNTIKFSSKGLHSKGCTRRNMNKLYIFNPFYLLDSGNKSLNKGWATPRLVSFRGLIQNFRRASPPLSYGSLPLEYCYGKGRSAPDCKTVFFSPKNPFSAAFESQTREALRF